jgi:hypothetical protein
VYSCELWETLLWYSLVSLVSKLLGLLVFE